MRKKLTVLLAAVMVLVMAASPAWAAAGGHLRCQWYPLYDVRSFSRQELVAPHELYLPYRPPPEVNPTKARDLSNKLCRNPTGEPNHVRVRQVAGRDVDEPFDARLGNAMVRHSSELPAKRVKSPVVRKYLREDGGRGEIESPHSKVKTGLSAYDAAQLA